MGRYFYNLNVGLNERMSSLLTAATTSGRTISSYTRSALAAAFVRDGIAAAADIPRPGPGRRKKGIRKHERHEQPAEGVNDNRPIS